MKKLFLAVSIVLFSGCVGPGLYSDGKVFEEEGWQTQSFPMFNTHVNEDQKKELGKLAKESDVYKFCQENGGDFVATYTEALIGEVTYLCIPEKFEVEFEKE